jgi:hypothetical protein
VHAGGGVSQGEPVAGPGSSDGLPEKAQADEAPTDVGSSVAADPAVASKGRHRSLIFGIIGAAIVVVVVIVGIFVFSEASAAISAGSGTATITWTPAPNNGNTIGNPPQSFAGNIGGHSVSGVATLTLPTGSTNPFLTTTGASKDVQVFRYKGSFAGKSFDIGVLIGTPLSPSSSGAESFTITGTYDGQTVHADLGAPTNPNLSSPPIPFHGTIGKWKVTGAIHGPTGTSQKQTATATYTVSS